MIAASAAPFYLPSACFPERSPPSCGGVPLQRHKAPNVVGQVLQANFGARSHDANRANDPAAQRGLLSCEHVLDAGANFASVVVGIRLRFRQRALASGPHMNTALEAAGAQSLLDRTRAIGTVAEHVRRRAALSARPVLSQRERPTPLLPTLLKGGIADLVGLAEGQRQDGWRQPL